MHFKGIKDLKNTDLSKTKQPFHLMSSKSITIIFEERGLEIYKVSSRYSRIILCTLYTDKTVTNRYTNFYCIIKVWKKLQFLHNPLFDESKNWKSRLIEWNKKLIYSKKKRTLREEVSFFVFDITLRVRIT